MVSAFFRQRAVLLCLLLGPVVAFGQNLTTVVSPSSASFQETNISELVNPSTGDLSYQLDLLDIPGPGGGYPLSLYYQSGIHADREASWVGLGWSFGDAKITRNIAELPDDYYAGRVQNRRRDPGGEEIVNHPSQLELFLSSLFEGQKKIARSASQAAINNSPARGWSRSNSRYNMSRKQGLQATASLTLFAYGLAVNPFSSIVNIFDMATTRVRPNYNDIGSWDYDFDVFHITASQTRIRWWIFQNTTQYGYGILHQHNMPVSPTINEFTGSDQTLNYFNGIKTDPYDHSSKDTLNVTSDYYQMNEEMIYDQTAPIFWATDNYYVNTPHLNGRLLPYRFDNATVAAPVALNQYYDEDIAVRKLRLAAPLSRKPIFAFQSDQSNYYDYNFRTFNNEYELKFEPRAYNQSNVSATALKPFFLQQSPALTTTENDREGFTDGHLVKGLDVQWWTNEEVVDGTAQAAGFMDHQANTARNLTGDFTYSNNSHPPKGIGGFMITDKDGIRYHFSLPVYVLRNEGQFSISEDRKLYVDDNFLSDPYAREWLLTGVTGTDFVDSGSNTGQIDHGDKGYYVVLEYGKFHDNFITRSNEKYTPDNINARVQNKNITQQYYVNKIATKTHSALFLKSLREDLVSDTDVGVVVANEGKSLKLDKILLVENAELENLDLNYGTSGNYKDNVLLTEDIVGIATHLQDITLRSVVFGQDYSLNPEPGHGKLTLNSLSLLGIQDDASLPPYLFTYDYNPPMHQLDLDWDAWGMYKKNEDVGPESHQRDSESESSAWSLTGIVNPRGDQVSISYESDDYASILQEHLPEGVTERLGGDIRVSEIELLDPMQGTTLTAEYRYTQDGTVSGSSSGVATGEPDFVLGDDEVVDDLFGFVGHGVTYGRVDRINRSGSSVLSKTSMNFHVGQKSMMEIDTLVNKDEWIQTELVNDSHKYGYHLKQRVYHVKYHDQLIGRMKSVLEYDRNDLVLNKTDYFYNESDLGRITQGLHLYDETFEKYRDERNSDNRNDKSTKARYVNTLTTRIPFQLSKVVNKDFAHNTQSETILKGYDFYTSEPTTIVSTDGYGNKFASISIPAYKNAKYAGAGGVQGRAHGGKNILNSVAERYTHSINNPNDDLTRVAAQLGKLVTGSVQTLKKEGGVWRTDRRFVLNATTLDQDGTINPLTTAQKFNHESSIQNNIWVDMGGVTEYDAFSHVLESQLINGEYESARYDGDNSRTIAVASNARLRDFVFSSAEEPLTGTGFTTGLTIGNGQRSSIAHSGQSSLAIPAGQTGFSFDIPIEARNNNKTYEVAFWVYNQSSPRFRLNYSIDGNAFSEDVSLNSSNSHLVAGWYLYVKTLPVNIAVLGASSSLSVSILNIDNTTIYVDDFKISPIDSQVTCFVYDDVGNLSFVFGPNHFYVQTVFDELGRVSEIYEETKQGVLKKESHAYNFGRD